MAKRVIELNKREIIRKRAALEKSKKRETQGVNAEDLKNKLLQVQSQIKPKKVISQQRRIISRGNPNGFKRIRPDREYKSINNGKPDLLIDAPTIGTKLSVLYPVPEWFLTKGKADVSVVVPLYKSKNVIVDLINSWDIHNDGLKVEIIFVDDRCPHNTKDVVIKAWEHRKGELTQGIGRILYNSQNKGYGGSCNTGADAATGDYIIYLNADTRVTSGWIKPIIDAFEQYPEAGIIGNMQLKDGGVNHGTIDSAGSEWLWEHGSFLHIGRHTYQGKTLPNPWRPENVPRNSLRLEEKEMVTGCCLAIRSDLNREIGGFNPNYRVGYWEDSDICLTVRERGWKVMFQPESVIHHKLGHTDSGAHEHQSFNRSFFFNKWVNSGRIDPLVKDSRQESRDIRGILLQRKGARGDVLVSAYVAGALKQKYPGCKIHFYTQCPEVLENHPHIDRVVAEGEFSGRQFQLIYNLDMAYEYRPHSNILQSYADVVGVKVEDCVPTIAKTEFETPSQPYIVIHAGRTSWVGRDWGVDKFSEISNRLMHAGKQVVCVGKETDHEIPCHKDLRGKTTMSQLAYVIQHAETFVGIDSFPFHVAQAVNTPGICYFGSILPKTRIYRDNMHGVNLQSLPCIGCHHRKSRPSVVTNFCETGTTECESKLDVEIFWEQLQKIIS